MHSKLEVHLNRGRSSRYSNRFIYVFKPTSRLVEKALIVTFNLFKVEMNSPFFVSVCWRLIQSIKREWNLLKNKSMIVRCNQCVQICAKFRHFGTIF